MDKRYNNGLKVIAAALLIAFLLVLCGVIPLNLTILRKPIASLLQDSSGLVFSVSGQLHLRLGLHPTLQATQLELLSGDGASYYARLANLNLEMKLARLLALELSFTRVALSGLTIDICQSTPVLAIDGESNTSDTLGLSLHQLEARDIEIKCSSDPQDLPVRLSTIQGSAVSDQELVIGAEMQWQGRAFALELGGAPLQELLNSSKPYPFKLEVTNESGSLELEADAEDLFGDLKFIGWSRVRLEQPDTLLALFDIQSAGLPPVALEGRLGYSGTRLFGEAMSGHYGAAPWSLSGSFDWGLQRPLLILTTQLDHLGLDSLLLPAPALPASGQPAALDLHQELPLSLLDLVDARIDLRLTDFQAPVMPSANAALHLELGEGQLQLDIMEFQSSLGSGSGSLTLDRSANCPAWALSASFSAIDLGALGESVGLDSPLVGSLQAGRATVAACGSSLAGIRETFEASAEFDGVQVQPGGGLPATRATSASLEAGWQRRTNLEMKLLLDDVPVDGRVEAGELALLDAGIDWPFQVELTAGSARFEASGSVNGIGEQVSARTDLKLSAPRMGSLSKLVGLNPQYQEAVALELHAYVDANLLEISKFKFSLARSRLTGKLVLQLADTQQDSELVLRSSLVDIEELDRIVPLLQEQPSSSGEPYILNWPNVTLDLAFAEIHLPEISITDVSLVGALRNERIENGRLALEVAAFSLLGELDADLSEGQSRFVMSTTVRDVDIGRILAALEVDENTSARAEQVQLLLTTNGRDRRDLLENVELDFELRQLDWLLPGQSSGDEQRLVLQEIVGSIRPDMPVSMHLAGKLDEFPVNGWLQLPPMGQLFDPVAPLPVKVVLGTDHETALLDGVFNRQGGPGLEAILQLSAIEKVVAVSDYAGLQAPLPGLVIDAAIDLGQNQVQTLQLSASLRGSRIEGKVVEQISGERDQLQIELTSPHLQTADFSKLVAVFGEGEDKEVPPDESETVQSDFLKILDDYLQWVPQRYDFDIKVTIDELMANEDFLGAADLHAIIGHENLELGKLKLTLPGGDVDLNYTMNHFGDEIHSKLDAQIEHFEVGGLLQTLDPESNASGLLYVDTRLDSVAPTTRELPQALQGHFDLALFPENLSANVLDLWATNLIFALMPRGEGDREDINCLVATFEVEDGVMQSQTIMLDSNDVIVRGKGSIDLGQRELDIIIAPQAKRERFLSVSTPLTVTGPFESFDIKTAAGGWLATGFRWYLSLVYVPWKWLTGERFPQDGTPTCRKAMGWEVDSATSSGLL